MNSPYYRSDEGPPSNKRTEQEENETRATLITPARLLSSGIDISPDVSEDDQSEEVKETAPRKFEGREARTSASRHEPKEAYSQDSEEEKEVSKEIEEKQKKALKRRGAFLKDLHEKERLEFKEHEKRSDINKVKFLLGQADTFMNFILNTQSSRRIKKDTTVKKFLQKGLSTQEIDQDQEQETTKLLHQPKNLKEGQLKDYQLDGLNWLIGLYERGLNGILADQMGLGKTIETIAFIAYLRTIRVMGPFLIIVPLSTYYNWRNEFKKWCPEVRLFMLRGIKERMHYNQERFKAQDFDVIITSYEGCIREMSKLRKFFFKAIVIDEAHRIKNEESILATKIRCFNSLFRMLLTGTPMQNSLRELWALLNYIFPDIFANAQQFEGMLDTTQTKGKAIEESIQKLHRILSFFMLRRTKEDVLTDLPKKKEYIIKIPLSKQQIKLYRRIIIEIGRVGSLKGLRNVLIQLRKACQHPYLFNDQIPFDGIVPLQIMIQASNKLAVLDKLLQKFKKEGHQVLIFSQFVMWIECLEYYLDLKGITYCKLVGSTTIEQRQTQIQEFTKKGSKIEVFVLSTRAGGLGINLTSASKVIIYDSDFNPHVDIQAIDRCHRIGQTKVVEVFRFVSKDTVEENIIERQKIKLRLDQLIVQQGRLAPRFKKLSNFDLQNAILHGADRFVNNAVVSENVYKDKHFDLDALLKESEQNAKEILKKVEEEIKDKLNDQILEDYELTYQKITCMDEKDQKEREKIKAKIQQEFLEQIIRPPERQRAIQQKSKPVVVQKAKRKIKAWQFPEKRERLMKLIELNNTEDEAEMDEIEATGFTDWKKTDTQNLIKGIKEEGLDSVKSLTKYVKKSKPEIKEYIDVMMARKEELDDCGLLGSFKRAMKDYADTTEYNDILKEYALIYNKEEKGERAQLSYISTFQRDLLVLTHQLGYGQWTEIKKKMLQGEQNLGLHYIDSTQWFYSPQEFKEKVTSALERLMKYGLKEKKQQDKRSRSKSKEPEKKKKKSYLEYSSDDERASVAIGEFKKLAPKNPKKKGVVRKK